MRDSSTVTDPDTPKPPVKRVLVELTAPRLTLRTRILSFLQRRQLIKFQPEFDEAKFLEGARQVFLDLHSIIRHV